MSSILVAACIVGLAACSNTANPVQPADLVTKAPSVDAIEASARPEPEVEPTAKVDSSPWGNVEAVLNLESSEGYESKLSVTAKQFSLDRDITNAPPGEADLLIRSQEGQATLLNSTEGRKLPVTSMQLAVRVIGVWRKPSPICRPGNLFGWESNCAFDLAAFVPQGDLFDSLEPDSYVSLQPTVNPVTTQLRVPEGEEANVRKAFEKGPDWLVVGISGIDAAGSALGSCGVGWGETLYIVWSENDKSPC